MKHILLYSLVSFMGIVSFSQNQKKIQKSWIKTAIVNLSGREIGPDTLYTRYTFDKSVLYISFYPAWDDYKQE